MCVLSTQLVYPGHSGGIRVWGAACFFSSSFSPSVLKSEAAACRRQWVHGASQEVTASEVSVPAVNRPYPSMTWCGSCCRGSRVAVCMFASQIHPPAVWVEGESSHEPCHGNPSQCVSFCVLQWRNGLISLRGLRNSQPHPLIVKVGFSSVQRGMFPAFRQYYQCVLTRS